MRLTSGTWNASTSGGSRTVASPGTLSAKRSLGLQFRGERDWQPAQLHSDGYLEGFPLIGYARNAATAYVRSVHSCANVQPVVRNFYAAARPCRMSTAPNQAKTAPVKTPSTRQGVATLVANGATATTTARTNWMAAAT
jgi:hypothetical protein